MQDSPAVELTAMSKKKIASIAIFMGVSREDGGCCGFLSVLTSSFKWEGDSEFSFC